ncbi:helix-turn-helix domain-containing protein [Salinimicrobium sp. TH3]|uniref:helix-turn-helix domain-containing protein n=1 Tax=Salinimicrobium sp. TH3 TaxID=2997342 RepID=UPI002272C365|nr:helix-turn-helix domain-containing protein [Salinimicrobium sp. TH3]MCY2687563.1 helix-turn-helix domain-containing protein [Salinimicrobium sp. TH3]
MKDLNLITGEDLKKLATELYQLSKKEAEENNQEDILNAKQAAKLLDLSPATIYGKTHRNEIPFFKQGKKLLFSRAALIEWLRKGENQVAITSSTTAKSKAAEYLHQNRRF